MTWLKNLNKNAIFLWVLIWIQIAGLFVAYQAGILKMIWVEDVTKLTLLISLVHIFSTVRVGIDTINKSIKWVDSLWLTADQTFAIGILGTLCGLIILMHEAFSTGIPTTPIMIQKMLSTMSNGLSTAFWCSATAVISSIIQKIQIMNLEMSNNENETITNTSILK